MMDALVQAALTKSSHELYLRCLAKFREFITDTLGNPGWFPATSYQVALYAAHLFTMGYAASTITSNISVLTYYHKLYASQDPASSFLVKRMLLGVAKARPAGDKRMPITRAILSRLVWATQGMDNSTYLPLLLTSMFTLAFYGFLRISEFTLSTKSCHTLQLEDIELSVHGLRIQFRSFKHHVGHPISIDIARTQGACPVKALSAYLKARPKVPGQLFIHNNGTPVTQHFFRAQLRACLQLAGYQSATIRSHSFRIGAATEAAMNGHSNDQIQRMGRWKSSAFLRYIRVPSLQSI